MGGLLLLLSLISIIIVIFWLLNVDSNEKTGIFKGFLGLKTKNEPLSDIKDPVKEYQNDDSQKKPYQKK